MSQSPRRDQLYAAYLLHHRPYRDTSRILDVFTRDHGRMTLFARGARGPKSRLAPLLQPFQPLLISWSGRGEAGTLTRAELAREAGGETPLSLPRAALLSAYYLNELLLRLTTRHDVLPAVFDQYHMTLRELRRETTVARSLRLFEKRLLETLGYGVELHRDCDGAPLEAQRRYRYDAATGFTATGFEGNADTLSGESILSLAQEELHDEHSLEDARRLLRAALASLLDGRELSTRSVARAVVRGGAR